MINLVNISGGLGNQLFQYFYGQSLILSFKDIKTKYVKGYTKKGQINLDDVFDIHLDLASTKEIYKYYNIFTTNKYLRSFYIRLIKNNFISEKKFNIDQENEIVDFNYEPKFHHGYWQCEDYFYKYYKKIKSQLRFKKSLNLRNKFKIPNLDPTIAVHVRRTDYNSKKNSKIFVSLDASYFKKKIQIMQNLFDKPQFIFFSDDYLWTKKNFCNLKIKKKFISESNFTTDEEFQLMTQCDHFIISNSTFSWWAAYLSNNMSKKIIYPKKWFKKNDFMNQKIIPFSWR